MKSVKRIGSGLMAAILLISLLPVQALAAETACPHHPEHTAECGYAPAVEGAPCTHEHTDDCYVSTTACILEDPSSPDELEAPAEDAHVCSEETDCITKTLNCPHARGEHDETCGYAAPSAGAACGFVCDKCPQEGKADPQGEQPQEPSGETPVCTCTERCEAGAANAQCPVCAADPAACGVTDVQEPQTPTCGGMEGCADGKHNPACPLYVAPTCGNLEGCADDQHNPVCPLYVAPTCSNLEGCADDQHNPACPLYVAPTCSNLEGCVDDKHDPNCPLYVAEEPEELADDGLTGPCGDNATYTLTPNDEAASTYTLTISGTGAMADYTYSWATPDTGNAPWAAFRSQITQIVVGDGITKIGNYAFIKTAIQSIDLSNCTNLTHIGERGIANIPTLTSIQLPSSIVELGSAAFSGTGIESVDLANCPNLTTLGVEAFSYCKQLKSVNIQQCEKLTTIGNSCFTQCTSLADLKLPKNIQTVGSSVLAYTAVTRVDWPNLPNLTSIGGETFKGNPNLTVISLAGCSSLQTLGAYLLADSGVVAVDITGCTRFEQIQYPEDFVGMKDGSVVYSSKELNLRNWPISCAIANGGTYAPSTTFEAGKLATPTKAGYGFGGWYASADFSGDAVTQPESGKTYYAKWVKLDGFCGGEGNGENVTWKLIPNTDAPSTYTLNLSGTGAMADVAYDWKGGDSAPWAAFRSQITQIVVGDGITKIGNYAFIKTAIQSIDLSNCTSLTHIGERGIANIPTLTSIQLPSSIVELGSAAFSATHIESIDLSNCQNLTTLGIEAFSYCKRLKSVNIQQCEKLTTIGNSCFTQCTSLADLKLPKSIQTVGSSVLAHTAVTRVDWSNLINLTSIEGQTFRYNPNLTFVSLAGCSSLQNLGAYLIRDSGVVAVDITGCTSFEQIPFPNEFVGMKDGGVVYSSKKLNLRDWPISCAITNGGTFAPDTSFEAGKLATPTKAGHVFLGWYENEDFTGAPVTQPVSGKTYYANWRELKPSAIDFTIWKNGDPVTEVSYGDTIILQAVVSQQTTRAAVNTVDFFLRDQKLGTAEVKGGTAEYVLQLEGENWKKGFQIGKNTLTAQYGGSDQLLDGSVTFDLTVNKASQIAPVLRTDFTVDYANEQLSAGDSVEIWTAKDGGKQLTAPVSLTEHLGKTLYARFKETDTHLASGWTDVSIAQRPAAPTGVTGGRATLTGVNGTMEYSLDGKTFIKVPAGAGKVENLTAGIYQVRIAATATAPASSAVQATVYDHTGSLTTTQTNGSVTTETTLRDDGTSTVVTTEKRPDGTVSALLENKDKSGKVTSSQQTITNPDGSKLVIQLPEDGSKVVTQYDKNGKVIQQTTYPDKNKPAYIITGFAPKIVEGNGRSFWGWSLSLRTDDALCNFQDVLVQGLSLNPSNYEVSEKDGTTQIILKRGYLAKLPAGTYKIGIVSTNGTAWGTFVIPAKGEGWNPGTGDYIFFTGATLLLSAAALTLLLLRKKRRQ